MSIWKKTHRLDKCKPNIFVSWSASELRVRLVHRKTGLSTPVKKFTDCSKAVLLLWICIVFCPLFAKPLCASKDGVKRSTFFLKIDMLHIKLKGMEQRAPCKHIFCPCTHPRPLGLGQKAKTFLNEILHIKLKGIEHRAPCKHIFCPYTHHPPPDGVTTFFLKVFLLHIKGNGE